MIYRKFHYPNEPYELRLLRLELHSLENRRLMHDEIVLYKIKNEKLKTSLTHSLTFGIGNRLTRQNLTFCIPADTTNIQYFAPMLRLQRQHNESFNHVKLDEPNLNAFKRYVNEEIRLMQEIYSN